MFSFPSITLTSQLLPNESDNLLRRPLPLISDWCAENIQLAAGYTNTGTLRFSPWQIEPVNAIMRWATVLLLGPTQTGKSLIGDAAIYYSMAVLGLEGMVIYCNEKTARKVFQRRIKPMIMKNRVFKKVWSGKDDDLSIENIQLLNCFWGIASAENRNDLASFPAGMVVWSEASKARATGYDIKSEIVGRQEGYPPHRRRILIETTPNETGDPMYREIYRRGTTILRPYVACPTCGEYQVLVDEQCKLRITGKEVDHDPARLRSEREAAVYYECALCKSEIRESDRPKMFERVVWAAPAIEERLSDKETFTQDGEVVRKDGTIVGADETRKKMLVPCYNWNRLVNPDFTFWECLARFFESRRTQEKTKNYLNNDMARFYHPTSERVAQTALEKKSLMSNYVGRGPDAWLPAGVLALLCGIDTQDDGFWYLVQGFGARMESWVIRYGWIGCPITDEENQDYQKVLDKVLAGLYAEPYRMRFTNKDTGEARILNLRFDRCFWDRGGHRSKAVDYCCSRIPGFAPYVGATVDDPKRDLVWDTGHGYYYGKTEVLSDMVGADMSMDTWHLPNDAGVDLYQQLTKQYHYNVVNRAGENIRKWKHGGDDHLRDCANMIRGAVSDTGLDEILFDVDECEAMRASLLARANRSEISDAGVVVEQKPVEVKSQRVDKSEEEDLKKLTQRTYYRPRVGAVGGRGGYFGGGRYG